MSNKQTTTKGFIILSIAGFINKGLALAYVPILTLIVGNFGNGIISAGYKVYIFILGLTNAGIPTAISKMVSEQNAVGNYKDSKKILKVAAVTLISMGLFFSVLMAAGAQWISDQIAQPKAYLTILALSPTLLFSVVSSSFRGFFQGRMNMIPTSVSQVLEQALNSILTIVFAAALIGYGVDKAAAGSTIGTSAGALGSVIFLFFFYLSRRNIINSEIKASAYNGPFLKNREILKQIFIISFPAILGLVAVNANDLIDLKFGVNRIMAGGIDYYKATELFGIFTNQYQKILNLPLAITATLPSVLVPAVSAAYAVKDSGALNRKITEGLKIALFIVIPSSVGLAVLPEPIITFVFFSQKYNQGSDLMMMGSWLIILVSVIYVQTAVLIGIGKPHIPPLSLLAGIVIKVFINYFLIAIPGINIKGAIIGTTAGYLLACILNYCMIRKFAGVKFDIRALFLKPVIASVAMGIFIYFIFKASYLVLGNIIYSGLLLNDISTLIAILTGAAVYFAVLLALGAVKTSDIQKLPAGNRINSALCRLPFIRRLLSGK